MLPTKVKEKQRSNPFNDIDRNNIKELVIKVADSVHGGQI